MESQGDNVNLDNIMKILIATDNHLGYCEKDPIRGNDSFIAFEEILELAVENEVDFILLGGDLFHDATPTQNSLQKCLKLLRRFTMGDKPIMIEFLSDQTQNFKETLNSTVNYEDPDLNISIPIFSIHGNHDDPSGFGRLSSLDLLSTTGLINYFGKWSDLTKIEINPILLKKGETQLALYGLSHIHDARLARLFHDFKVLMNRPDESTSGKWFNLMVLHQNRADRGPKNYLPEEELPDFLDLVIWGHEHGCRIIPEQNEKNQIFVSQPGSSVATSLAKEEAWDKHCGLLFIHKEQFKMEPIRLKSVRPFIFESITLMDYVDELKLDEGEAPIKIMNFAKDKIENMIKEAESKRSDNPNQPTLPIIRLRIIYHEENQLFNGIRFGQQYNKRIANPQDVILFKKAVKRLKNEFKQGFDKSTMDGVIENQDFDSEWRVEDVVERYFEDVDETKKLKLMSSKILSEMCYRIVDRNDTNAAENIIKFYKQAADEYLMDKLPSTENLEDELLRFKENSNKTYEKILKMLDERGEKANDSSFRCVDLTSDDKPNLKLKALTTTASRSKAKSKDPVNTSSDLADTSTSTTRGRGRGRGRGSRGGRVSNKQMSTQQTLIETLGQSTTRAGSLRNNKSKIVYDISSGSD